MRVASGTAATAGAPAAVTSSGSRGDVTTRASARDHAGRQRDREQRVDPAAVVTPCRDPRPRDDPPARTPLDVHEPAELDLAARLGRRERERRAAEDAPAAIAELHEAAVAARAHDAPRAQRPVEELDADPDPLRRVAAVGNRHADADAAGILGRVARVDRRPRVRDELRTRVGGPDRERREQRRGEGEERGAAGAGCVERAHAPHRIEHVAAEKPSGSAPTASGWPPAVSLRTRRVTAPSRRHSNVTRPRSTNAGRPAPGGEKVNVRPAWRTFAPPWPRSTNPESAPRPSARHELSERRRYWTWTRR